MQKGFLLFISTLSDRDRAAGGPDSDADTRKHVPGCWGAEEMRQIPGGAVKSGSCGRGAGEIKRGRREGGWW